MSPAGPRVLTLPGWMNSGPGHWMTLWEAAEPTWRRVQQANWEHPRRSDWVHALEAAVQAMPGPLLLIAHSLGCLAIAHWATASPATQRVRHALLVAPPDIERDDLDSALRDFAPAPRQPLPFTSTLVASRNDPYCHHARARAMADAWGSQLHDIGPAGHINVAAGYGPWPQGHALALQLLAR